MYTRNVSGCVTDIFTSSLLAKSCKRSIHRWSSLISTFTHESVQSSILV